MIYEITAAVEPELAEGFEKFMSGRHIPDLLATGHFNGAEIVRAAGHRYRIRYLAPGRRELDAYLNGAEARRLRADFLAHFPAGVTIEREVWEVLQSWSNAVSKDE